MENVLYFQEISQKQSYFNTIDCATGTKLTLTQIYETNIPILYLWHSVLSSIHLRGNKIYIYSTDTNIVYRTYLLDTTPQYASNYLFINNVLYFVATDASTRVSCLYGLASKELKRSTQFSMDILDGDYKYITISYLNDNITFCCPNITRTDMTYIQLLFSTFIMTTVPNTSIFYNQGIQPMTSLLQVPEINYKFNIISNEQFSSLSSIINKKGVTSSSAGIDLDILTQFTTSICILPTHVSSANLNIYIPKEASVFVKSDIYIDYLNWIINNYDTSQYTTVYFYNQLIFKWPFYLTNDRAVSLQVNLYTISTIYDNFFMSMGKVNMTDMTIMSRRIFLPIEHITPVCHNNGKDYMVQERDTMNRAIRNKIINLFIALRIPCGNDFSWSPYMYYKVSLSVIRSKPLEFWKKVVRLLNTNENMDLYSVLSYFWTHLFL